MARLSSQPEHYLPAAQQRDVILQKVQVPGTSFDIVLAMSRPPTIPTFGAAAPKDALVTYPIGEELAYATTHEIENMLKEVGSSHMPIHAFQVESNGHRSSTALNVYVVPRVGTSEKLEPMANIKAQ